ncbi:hypothetical protein F66182_8311 [Fusarium sp. NRRL 66182]|nr:hypothetical protein F66182_8311 [Fusarium sp. NRRL 66182]
MPLPRQCFSRCAILTVAVCFIIVAITIFCSTYFTLAKKHANDFDWTTIGSLRGDRLPDFSFCGYHSSAIILPTDSIPNITVSFDRSSDDVRAIIQRAIDNITSSGGGSVILPPGRWPITAGIQLRSNVVVTGAGGDETTLVLKGRPSEPVFTLGSVGNDTSSNATKPRYGFRSNITNNYVPIGSSMVEVHNSTGFVVDQLVYISREATESWISHNGMGDLVRDGALQTWIPVRLFLLCLGDRKAANEKQENKRILSPNQISAISGTNVTLRIPLTDSLDSDYVQPELITYTPPEVNNEMGVQNLGIEVPESCSGTPLTDETCNQPAIYFPPWTVDSWANGLTLKGFNMFFKAAQNAARITIQNSTMNRDRDIEGAALPFDISIQGSQVLVQDCEQVGVPNARCFSVATESLTAGPNAVLRHKTMSNEQTIYPHERWAQGLLVEQTSVPTLFVNRGIKGTGHGWSINAGVGWNLDGEVEADSPPLGVNWCIGCGGKGNEPKGNATFICSKKRVKPASLFMTQLERRGVYRYTEEIGE